MENAKNILVLCTGNSARSIMAEGLLNQLAKGKYNAFSAGSKPTGTPHPMAISTLEKFAIDTSFARSKSWDEFAQSNADAPNIDLVITVCGNAENEVCPIWHSSGEKQPLRTHWGMEDPAKFEGSVVMQQARFDTGFSLLRSRIKAFLELDQNALTQEDLDKISQISN